MVFLQARNNQLISRKGWSPFGLSVCYLDSLNYIYDVLPYIFIGNRNRHVVSYFLIFFPEFICLTAHHTIATGRAGNRFHRLQPISGALHDKSGSTQLCHQLMSSLPTRKGRRRPLKLQEPSFTRERLKLYA